MEDSRNCVWWERVGILYHTTTCKKGVTRGPDRVLETQHVETASLIAITGG